MKQKLALVAALLTRPALLLLDEPTTGVDPVSRREFWKLLSEFLAAGLTIVMATPYLDEAERCGRVALLHEGAVMALDEPATLQSALPGLMLEVSAEGARPPIEALSRLPGVDDVQLFGDRAHVRLSGEDGGTAERVAAGLKDAGVSGATVRAVPPSLEDVFIHLVTRAGHAGGNQPVHGA
jgi:ABC-2 type transport system ATP-binding protein